MHEGFHLDTSEQISPTGKMELRTPSKLMCATESQNEGYRKMHCPHHLKA